ncbi:2-oxoacid:acceptor oxidoreductase family protein [Victivallis sp. Marseille-Q1083]|uniref:2-oxoacid:acceptor oxidoreductase family protein n=1 Tax=Victivallis sp. Marseille-Q1083 TaxID=2717288 RepID=UPI00158C8E78|nr:2-oxoacid:acceptor oxidoreductase family protein [Victivallis sp. Marseille-Q1083]
MNTVKNITVAGLGGQGVLKVTDILAEALFEAGFDVKKSEVHGMSQRGGSVSSEVRFGAKVASPMIPEGETDMLIVLDNTQIEVNLAKLKQGGILITPDDIDQNRLENKKAINIALLGALSKYLELEPAVLWETAKRYLPEKLHAVNEAAFQLGAAS